ncbi:TetR/AcrR family transcriptional regulator [Salinisphaera orenii]|uniref:TetR family transcriptional regulator n=1 Tax=Salinisphaera orenii YIM 95161 TaxID=1051139 RepID=A0A423PHS3_9GAMM|nr:TetR/AcrR family transcriptional regulator [Salinisphaera halophila]ROO25182.1 TetR family transcriptional regulator [Salinisphaera halophila YIM 95161]
MTSSDSPALRPTTARGEATRQKILRAAEQAFGTAGFFRASISDITRGAGVAQGTFYLYFQNKEDVLGELVRHMGRELRRMLTYSIPDGLSRLEAERAGLAAFMHFVSERQNLYRVVQESLFVDEQIYKDYYMDFARGYISALEKSVEKGDIRDGDLEVWVWILMGVGHFLGLRYGLWSENGFGDAELDAVMDFIRHGIAPTATGPR